MKRFIIFILFLTVSISAQVIPVAPNTSAAITDDAGSLVLNPAGLGIQRRGNFLLLGQSNFEGPSGYNLSLYSQVKRSGFGFTFREEGRSIVHWGSGQHFGQGFYMGNTSHLSIDGFEAIDLGIMYRGFPQFSSGLMWKSFWSRKRMGREDQMINLGFAFRPFGNRITFAYDHRFSFPAFTYENPSDLGGIAEIQTELLDGLKLVASYDLKEKGVQIGLGFGFGEMSIETYHDLDADNMYVRNLTGFLTSEEIRRSIFRKSPPTFVELSFALPVTDSPSPRVFLGPKTITLKDLRDAIKEMAKNPEIDGIILKPDLFVSGIGMMEEIYRSLLDFKENGKTIYAFLDMGSDISYALATVADSIYLNSGGLLMVDGLAVSISFLKGLFDKIGVEAQFYRRGDYKTAAEQFTRESLTETSREAYEEVLRDMHQVFSTMIKQGRGWSGEKLNEVYEDALYTPPMALEAGLIDGIFFPDQIKSKMENIFGKKVKIQKVDKRPRLWKHDWEDEYLPKIAIIYAEGTILPGRSLPSPFIGTKVIGSKTTTKAIRKAREDNSIKAIVMRVNSPGGSILASEDIWREVHRTTHPDSADKKYRKPFIISMANVAGSGGYYIACAADSIVSDSSTITGSIGVLSGKISFEGLMKKIGLQVEIVKEQPHAEQNSFFRPFTDEEGERMQSVVDSYYEQFIERVSEGRNMSLDEVDSIAQGRIWSGVDAKEIGLVDDLGGLDRALEIAREAAQLKEDRYQVVIFKGVEGFPLQFQSEAQNDLSHLLKALDADIPFSRLLDRAKLIHDEPFLFLMEGELISTD